MNYPTSSWADTRLEVRPSTLGGVGGFATARIAAGETLLVLGGAVLTQREMERTLSEYVVAGNYFNSMQVEEEVMPASGSQRGSSCRVLAPRGPREQARPPERAPWPFLREQPNLPTSD